MGVGEGGAPLPTAPVFLRIKSTYMYSYCQFYEKTPRNPPPNKNANAILNPIHALHQLQYSDDVVEHKYDSKCKIGNKIYTPEM